MLSVAFGHLAEVAPNNAGVLNDILIAVSIVLGLLAIGAVIYAHMTRTERQRMKRHYSDVVSERDSRNNKLRDELNGVLQVGDDLRAKISQLVEERGQLEVEKQLIVQRTEEHRRRHAPFQKLLHNICVIGIAGSGKTGLISKLVNPGPVNIKGLAMSGREERFDRTAIVSQNSKDGRIEHVFTFRVFGGEFKIQAQSALIDMCRTDYQRMEVDLVRRHKVQGLVFVVDIAWNDDPKKRPDPREHRYSQQRIDEQLNNYFNEQAVQFFIEPIRDGLQSIVLFINKIDRLEVDPSIHGKRNEQIEEWVKERYIKLIATLRKYTEHRIPVEIIVGSALTDAGLCRLFSTLATHILEKEIRENQRGSVDVSMFLQRGNGTPSAGSPDHDSVTSAERERPAVAVAAAAR